MRKLFGLVIVVIASLCLPQFTGCTDPPDKKAKKKQRKQVDEDEEDKVPNTKVKVTIQDLKKGTGAEAKKGDTVVVHYAGKVKDGDEFDNSWKRKEPFKFTIGVSSVIQGWHEGVPGMKVGGKRKLIIPPELGYREEGKAPIPPNATLIFEIELLKIEKEEE
jgi:FKBP-type peptidyl-prolyl cis-trans isomerase